MPVKKRDRKRQNKENNAWQYSDSVFDFDFEAMCFTVAGDRVELFKTEQRLLRIFGHKPRTDVAAGISARAHLAGRYGICGRQCVIGHHAQIA